MRYAATQVPADYASGPKIISRAISNAVSSKSISRPAVSVLQPMADTAVAKQFTGNNTEVIQGIGPIDWLKEKYYGHKRLGTLSAVWNEAVATMNGPNVGITGHNAESDTALPARAGAGRYTVRINPDDPVPGFGRDPDKLQSIIMHELTHVAVDRGYRDANGNRPVGERPANMEYVNGADATEEALDLANQHDEVLRAFTADNLIPDTERPYILSRIGRMANTMTEFDTVANELVLYFHLKGIPARSETSKLLTAKAKARHTLRTAQ